MCSHFPKIRRINRHGALGFWLLVQRGCSDRERRILSNVRERAALLGSVTSLSTIVTRSRDLPERPASVRSS
jgi:hypothetical protein